MRRQALTRPRRVHSRPQSAACARYPSAHGALAQLGEHQLCKLGVTGSIPVRSIHREVEDPDLPYGRRVTMAGVEKRDFDSPDERRAPDKTRVDVVRMSGTTAARFTMEPGWRWSECVKPVAGTESCQHRHIGVVQSGRMQVTHDDGTTLDLGPGDAYV